MRVFNVKHCLTLALGCAFKMPFSTLLLKAVTVSNFVEVYFRGLRQVKVQQRIQIKRHENMFKRNVHGVECFQRQSETAGACDQCVHVLILTPLIT